MNYYDVLGRIHSELLPRTYVEVGVRHGESMRLASPGTRAVGIDPVPDLRYDLSHVDLTVATCTSDDYFGDADRLIADLETTSFDFAFIDGMHQFEFVLRAR